MTARPHHPHTCVRLALTLLLGMLIAHSQPAGAQLIGDVLDRLGVSTKLRVNGSVGFMGEAYSVSGIASRRQPVSGRMTARFSASGYGLSYGLNMMLSSEQAQFQHALQRQSINRIDLRMKYRWLETDVGTVSPRLSEYSLSGVTLRGGFLELTPGLWRVTLTGGVEREAVAPVDGIGAVFQRWIYAGRAGYGKVGYNYIDLVGVYAFDDASSLNDAGTVVPASNLSISTISGLRLLEGRLQMEGQLTASGYVQDTNSAISDASPGFLFDLGLMDARVGSNLDYAGRINALINVQPTRIQLGYERIQPGFRSLGLGQIRSDQEMVRLRPQAQFLNGRLRLSGEFSQRRNNLLNDLQSTLRRRQMGLNAQVRFSDVLSLTSTYNRLANTNLPVPGSVQPPFRQIGQTLTMSPVMTLRRDETTHNVTLVSSMQSFDDRSADVRQGLRPGSNFTNATATLNYGVALPSGLAVNASGSMLSSKTTTSEMFTLGINAGGSRGFFERALQVNVNGGWSRSGMLSRTADGDRKERTGQLTVTSNLVYRMPSVATLSFAVRGLAGRLPTGANLREIQTTLRIERRF